MALGLNGARDPYINIESRPGVLIILVEELD